MYTDTIVLDNDGRIVVHLPTGRPTWNTADVTRFLDRVLAAAGYTGDGWDEGITIFSRIEPQPENVTIS